MAGYELINHTVSAFFYRKQSGTARVIGLSSLG